MSAFSRRISTQAMQIKCIFLHVIGLGQPPTDTQRAGLVRDSFGLHKMLVVLTRSGKIFGIDNISGKHHWQLYLSDVQNFVNQEPMRLLVQRTSKHFPLQPLCTVVAKEEVNKNKNILLSPIMYIYFISCLFYLVKRKWRAISL